MRKQIAIGVVVLLVVFAGCSGGGGGDGGDGGDGASDGDAQAPDGSDGGGGDGSGVGVGGPGSMSACEAGEAMSYRDPQTGQEVSWQVDGMVTRDGRDLCKARFEPSGEAMGGGQFAAIEMYFDTDGTYTELVYLDERGNVLFSVDASGGRNGTVGMGNININGSMPGMNGTMPGGSYTVPDMNVTVPDVNYTVPG